MRAQAGWRIMAVGAMAAAASIAAAQVTTEPARSDRRGALPAAQEARAIERQMQEFRELDDRDLRIGVNLTEPASWYELRGQTLSWRDPDLVETHHLMVTVQDLADGRTMPGCKVTASVSPAGGASGATSVTLQPIWGKEFYYYGTNLALAEGTTQSKVTVQIDPPPFARRDKELGAFFITRATAEWPALTVPESAPRERPARPPSEAERGQFGPGRYPAVTPTPYPGAPR